MTTLIGYLVLIAWVSLIIWRALHYVVTISKKVTPTKLEVKKALTNTPQNLGQIQIKILEFRKFLPRKPNIFGLYDKTFPLIDFVKVHHYLKALIDEGEATEVKVIVSPERAKRIGKTVENAYQLKIPNI